MIDISIFPTSRFKMNLIPLLLINRQPEISLISAIYPKIGQKIDDLK
jgi:hypothetical protein